MRQAAPVNAKAMNGCSRTKGPSLNKRVARKDSVEMAKTQRTTPAKSERIGHCGI